MSSKLLEMLPDFELPKQLRYVISLEDGLAPLEELLVPACVETVVQREHPATLLTKVS